MIRLVLALACAVPLLGCVHTVRVFQRPNVVVVKPAPKAKVVEVVKVKVKKKRGHAYGREGRD